MGKDLALNRIREGLKELRALQEHLIDRTISPILGQFMEKGAREAGAGEFEHAYSTLHDGTCLIVRELCRLGEFVDGVVMDLSAAEEFLEGK